MGEPNSARKFFNDQPAPQEGKNKRFETKRQASKYLNHYGKVWKEEHNIPMSDPKRKVN